MQQRSNWFKVAQAAMDAQEGQTEGQATQQGVPAQNAAVQPAPTPTPVQNAATADKRQKMIENVHRVAIPDLARRSLPVLNQVLYSLGNEVTGTNNLHLQPAAAKAITIEIIAEWLAAVRQNGSVSNLETILANSPRLNAMVDQSV
jgi:hypothetical protein